MDILVKLLQRTSATVHWDNGVPEWVKMLLENELTFDGRIFY
jgi:hypothetical protein